MTKIKLLATSVLAFGMFNSAEGMNGLPKLNLATGNTNSVNQFAAVTQFTSNSNAVNLQESEDPERIRESFQALSDKLIKAETDETFEEIAESNWNFVSEHITFGDNENITGITSELVGFLWNIVSAGRLPGKYYDGIMIPAGKSLLSLWNSDNNKKMDAGKLFRIICDLNDAWNYKDKINIDDFKKAIKADPATYFLYTDEEYKFKREKITHANNARKQRLQDSIDAKIWLLRTFKEYYESDVISEIEEIIDDQTELLIGVVGDKTDQDLEVAKQSSIYGNVKMFLGLFLYDVTTVLAKKGFSTKERTLLGLTTPDNYCLFIASRHFDTLDDHTNLLEVSKRLGGNMEKFHYNPISVDEKTVRHFPNTETLHVYDKNDKYLEGGRISKYVDWRYHSLSEVLEKREKNPEKNIEFKNVTCDKDGFWNLLQTTGNELVDQGIITLANNNAGYIKGNIKSIDLEKFETTYSVKITEIGNGCFSGCEALQEIIIPEGVTKIGNECFLWCYSLQEIALPSSVKCIGFSCFFDCKSLKKITLPSSLESIGDKCFFGCTSLQEITLPSSLESIGDGCFFGCASLQEITIPEGVTELKDRCFCECESLKKIIIPEGVTKIGNECFVLCKSLQEIDLPSTLKKLGEAYFYRCESLKKIIIPEGVTEIGNECFFKCKSLKEITLPSSLKSIGDGCFLGCTLLQEITIPEDVTKLKDECFWGCLSLKKIIIPEGVTKIGAYCFVLCESLQEITLPSSLESIGYDCFLWCQLKTLNIDVLNGTTETVNLRETENPTDQIVKEMAKLRSLNLQPKK